MTTVNLQADRISLISEVILAIPEMDDLVASVLKSKSEPPQTQHLTLVTDKRTYRVGVGLHPETNEFFLNITTDPNTWDVSIRMIRRIVDFEMSLRYLSRSEKLVLLDTLWGMRPPHGTVISKYCKFDHATMDLMSVPFSKEQLIVMMQLRNHDAVS